MTLSAYTMNPEEFFGDICPIGVFCHEYGHFIGLPDLYDISDAFGSNGLGSWSLMASGNYNGTSRLPAHLDAWCKAQAGFLTPIQIDQNMHQVLIPYVEDNAAAFRLQNGLSGAAEYWILENRQPVGFDAALPGFGLCLYHVDNDAPGPSNQNPAWYHVAMEQADGDNHLAFGGSRGDAGDPWPGSSGARAFHDLSIPNSRTNDLGPYNNGATTRIGLWEISNSSMIMTADLDEDWSRPWPELAASDSVLFVDDPPGGNGVLEPGETVSLYCTFTNLMREAYNSTIAMTCDNPSVTITTPQVFLTSLFDDGDHSNLTPIEFTLADAFVPVIDSFTLTVVSDSAPSETGSDWYTSSFPLEMTLGPPQVLIVDDDRGQDYEQIYRDILYRQQIPHAVWHKDSAGSPPGATLQSYRMVFWHTGDSSDNVFSADDVTAMKSYLDAGGRLMLSSISGAHALHVLDSGFMYNYLGAYLSGSLAWPFFDGVSGHPLGDGTRYRYMPSVPLFSANDLITPIAGGEAAFTLGGRTEVCGVTRETTYRSILLTVPIEYLSDQFSSYETKDTLIMRVIDFFGGIPEITTESGCCQGIRGDMSDPLDGVIDIGDLVYLIDYMFTGGPEPPCAEEADINADGAEAVDISDLLYLIDYMFTGGPAPAACP